MYEKHKIGELGEDIACKYLTQSGYKIIERNFDCKLGEIDIIAKDKEYLVFIEVKTRTGIKYGEAKDAVNINKKKHIYRSAEYYTYKYKLENKPIRIDVIEIYKRKEKYFLHHIKQAITEKQK